MNIRTGMLY